MTDALSVRAVQNWEVEPWILRKHYARRMPPISYAFGLYNGNELIGVVTYGFPASRNLCQGICGNEYVDQVLELNRLVLSDNIPNHASILVSRSLKMLPRPRIIVSYADTSQGHVGYVYQATNWIYTGLSARRFDPKKDEGDTRHNRTNFVRGKEQVERPRKHRYIFFVGSKKEVKIFRQKLKYDVQSYPKGETKRYDSSANIETQIVLL